MTQEVLKLALEALEEIAAYRPMTFAECSDAEAIMGIAEKTITAIKEALRENAMREVQRLGQEIEQEPVVGIAAIRTWFKDGRVVTQTLCNSWIDTTQPQLEERNFCPRCGKRTKDIHTCTPPQRTWVGLTDDEMTHTNHHMVEGAYQYSFKQGAKWAEAKLKEKNT